MPSKHANGKAIGERSAKRLFVPLGKMMVRNGVSQREANVSWGKTIGDTMDVEKLGIITVNKVKDIYWIVDGQHRWIGLQHFLGEGWTKQSIECDVFENLSVAEEADLFCGLNDARAVAPFDLYTSGVTAGYEEETNIEALLRKHKLQAHRHKIEENTICCVSALRRVYRLGVLDNTLKIARGAFGRDGLESQILTAIGMVRARFAGTFKDEQMIEALRTFRDGAQEVWRKSGVLVYETGSGRMACMAAVIVDRISKHLGLVRSQRLSWWKKTDETEAHA
jgi:hypothetical protein